MVCTSGVAVWRGTCLESTPVVHISVIGLSQDLRQGRQRRRSVSGPPPVNRLCRVPPSLPWIMCCLASVVAGARCGGQGLFDWCSWAQERWVGGCGRRVEGPGVTSRVRFLHDPTLAVFLGGQGGVGGWARGPGRGKGAKEPVAQGFLPGHRSRICSRTMAQRLTLGN